MNHRSIIPDCSQQQFHRKGEGANDTNTFYVCIILLWIVENVLREVEASSCETNLYKTLQKNVFI